MSLSSQEEMKFNTQSIIWAILSFYYMTDFLCPLDYFHLHRKME